MLDRILGRTKPLEKALDATWLRNEAISQNIANVDTPGYKRKTVIFEDLLNKALEDSKFKGFGADKGRISISESDLDEVKPIVMEDNKSLSMRLDGNNVDIDKEMADMSKNTIQYNVLIQRISSSFRSIKSVISEGRR